MGEHQLQEKTLKTLETYVNRVKGEHIRESQDGFDKIGVFQGRGGNPG